MPERLDDVYYCPCCDQTQRFNVMFHIGKNIMCGVCLVCGHKCEGEELEELYEKGEMVD